MGAVPENHLGQVLQQVFTIQHHDGEGGHPKNLELPRKKGMFIRAERCELQPCKRCSNRKGGYIFPFVDPRWTGEHFMSKDLNFTEAMAVIDVEGPGPRLQLVPSGREDMFDTQVPWMEARRAELSLHRQSTVVTDVAVAAVRMQLAKDTIMASGIPFDKKTVVLIDGIGAMTLG